MQAERNNKQSQFTRFTRTHYTSDSIKKVSNIAQPLRVGWGAVRCDGGEKCRLARNWFADGGADEPNAAANRSTDAGVVWRENESSERVRGLTWTGAAEDSAGAAAEAAAMPRQPS